MYFSKIPVFVIFGLILVIKAEGKYQPLFGKLINSTGELARCIKENYKQRHELAIRRINAEDKLLKEKRIWAALPLLVEKVWKYKDLEILNPNNKKVTAEELKKKPLKLEMVNNPSEYYDCTIQDKVIRQNLTIQAEKAEKELEEAVNKRKAAIPCYEKKVFYVQRKVFYHEEGKGIYHIYKQKMTWAKANNLCVVNSGHLAIIDSKEEEELLAKFMRNSYPKYGGVRDKLWIGARRLVDEDWFRSCNVEPAYQNWMKVMGVQHPVKGNDCAVLHVPVNSTDYGMMSVPCSEESEFEFICEFSPYFDYSQLRDSK